MKHYVTIYVPSIGLKRDTEELNRVIGVHSEDNYILHSVVPKISEGDTDGYILIFVR